MRGVVHVPIGKRIAVGWDKECKKPITTGGYRVARPGELVQLPSLDTQRLRALGMIKDPNDPTTPPPTAKPTRGRIEMCRSVWSAPRSPVRRID